MLRRTLISLLAGGVLATSAAPALALTPNDTFYGRQWYLPRISAEQAWEVTTGSPTVVVAVIDTAMDIDHEDLKENIWTNSRETFGNGIDDDGNGYIDDLHGWNFVQNSPEVRPPRARESEHGYVHATLVASLIAAKGNNDIGIAGVAWNVRILPLVALDENGDGSTESVAAAIRYAVDHGAQIINLSLEGYADAPELDDALVYAQSRGVLTVAAAGNSTEIGGVDLDATPVYPACLSLDTRYGVAGTGSTDRADQKAPYANYGGCIQVSAPGDDIFAARPTLRNGEEIVSGYEGGYSGTSLAAPLLSGAAALIKSVRPDWGWAEIRDRILSTADPVDHLQQSVFIGKTGRGRLNIAAAVAGLRETAPASVFSELVATVPGRATRVYLRTAANTVEIAPFGTKDTRGARAAFADMDADGTAEIVVVAASGRATEWIAFDLMGKERRRGALGTGGAGGLLIAGAGDGVVIADPRGGAAWGVAGNGTVTTFRPYGTAYRGGLDLVEVPGGVAFAPRNGGGHLMVMDRTGKRLVSTFPFGTTARGRWSVARITNADGSASLVMSGPSGSRSLDIRTLGAAGWQDNRTESARLIGSEGSVSATAGERIFGTWTR